MSEQDDLSVYIVCVIIGVVSYLMSAKPLDTRRFRLMDALKWAALTVFMAFIFTGDFR